MKRRRINIIAQVVPEDREKWKTEKVRLRRKLMRKSLIEREKKKKIAGRYVEEKR